MVDSPLQLTAISLRVNLAKHRLTRNHPWTLLIVFAGVTVAPSALRLSS